MIMVKPATAYLDVISDAKELAKNVSKKHTFSVESKQGKKKKNNRLAEFFFFIFLLRSQLLHIRYLENMP